MRVVNFSETNSLLKLYINEMRDKNIQTDPLRFRRNIQRIGEIMAYEISKTFKYEPLTVATPLDDKATETLAEPVVLATILRAGLPMHTGMLNYLDHAENAFVSAYREYTDATNTDVRINIEYLASPRLDGKTLIICDPMLATGGSMELGLKALLTKGKPQRVHLCSIIAAQQAIDYLQQQLPDDITLWIGDIDPVLNSHKYIVPGLGDAGDLAFGVKE